MHNLVRRNATMAMIPSLLLLLLFSFPSVLAILKSDDPLQFVYHMCNNQLGNFTSESDDTYSNNRNTLLSKMYSDREIDYGFYNFSYGEDPDQVFAIGLCRGDVKPDECRSCLAQSASQLRDRCPVQKEAIGWFEQCMLRYSNHSMFGQMETDITDIVKCSSINTTNRDGFDKALDGLVETLRSTAADGDSRRKLAEGAAPIQSSNETIYGLLQCTPNLSYRNCTECLEYAMSRISVFCGGLTGGRYLGRSCSVRYETKLFYIVDVPAPAPLPLPFPPPPQSSAIPITPKKDELLQFDFATIKFATNNFSDANKLGQGGFGIVYKIQTSM